ncbi:uncharacterized protein LOC133723114 [Rosa rugosa]|uniref:uncharacterized protein LOC133723114 n=1 Tax=Rosa rugosa TaxID=74645 RepID=UPI002B409ED6|nr:uncharacterized protein LOC133723114 [Rosa rugosa]
MDEYDFKRKWFVGVFVREYCISEIDSRNCKVRNWSVDISAACYAEKKRSCKDLLLYHIELSKRQNKINKAFHGASRTSGSGSRASGSGSASRASGSGSRASSSRAIPPTKAADQTFVEVSGSRASLPSGSQSISRTKVAGQTFLEISGSRASLPSGSRASGSGSRAISRTKVAGQTFLEVEVAAPPVTAPPAAYDPLALSLETTGLPLQIAPSRGHFFSQLVVAEDFRLSFLSIQQMKTIVFYYSHILRIEGYDSKSHAVLSSFVSCRMMPRMTIQQELEAARNRVRFDQGERCRGTYAGLFLTLLRTVAQLWVELEAQHFSLSRVLSIRKESLKMYCQIFDASLL